MQRLQRLRFTPPASDAARIDSLVLDATRGLLVNATPALFSAGLLPLCLAGLSGPFPMAWLGILILFLSEILQRF